MDNSPKIGGVAGSLQRAFPFWGARLWPWLTFGAVALLLLGYLGASPGEALRTLLTPADDTGYYQRLAEAFLHGRAYLSASPPDWLLNAPNPYDPATSWPVRVYGIHDAILFEDRYWYYWPPGVVAFLVAPLRAIGVQVWELQVGFVALIAIAACGTDAAMILQWARGASRTFCILIALAIGLPFSAVFLVSRIAIWESNALAAGALAAIALQCFVRFWTNVPGSSGRTLAVGCIVGALATTVRPEAAIVFLVPMAQFVIGRVGPIGISPVRPRTISLVLLAPALGVLFVLAYNAWRFGSPLDFKVRYMLTGYADQSKLVFSSTQYLVPNSYYYWVRPVGLSDSFPIINFEAFRWPFNRPLAFSDTEPAVGAFWVMPWAFVALIPLIGALLVSGIRPPARKLVDSRFAILALLLLVAGVALIAFLSVTIFSPTERYHLLPAVLIGVAGMTGLAAVPELFTRVRTARVFRGLVSFLLLWTIVVALVGGSEGYYQPGANGRAASQSLSGKAASAVAEGIARIVP